jgi:hypothetical protein
MRDRKHKQRQKQKQKEDKARFSPNSTARRHSKKILCLYNQKNGQLFFKKFLVSFYLVNFEIFRTLFYHFNIVLVYVQFICIMAI